MSHVLDIDPFRGRAQALRLGIAAVVVAVIVSMWTVVAISIDQSRQTALKDMALTAANLAFAFDEDMTRTLDHVAGTVDAVANRMRAEEAGASLYAWSRQFPIVTGPIADVGIIAPNGTLIAEARSAKVKPIDLSREEYFRIQLDGKFTGLFIGKPTNNGAVDQPLIPITKRVEASGGRLIGVLIFYLSPAKLTSLSKTIDLGDNGTITLIGGHGVALARFSKKSSDGLADIGDVATGAIDPDSIESYGQGSFIQQSTRDDVKRLFSYRRLADYPLVVSVGLDYEEGLALAHAHARTILALAAVATLLLSSLAFYLIHEIHKRAIRDAELAGERGKLRTANSELQTTNAQLTEAKQIAESASQAKSLFLANMSHELRTPLNAIIGFSQIIKDQSLGPRKPVYADYAKDIFTSGEHLLEIINNLLDISKIEAGKTEIAEDVVALPEILAASLAAVRVQAEQKGIGLVVDVPRGLPRIRGDAVRLRQVLINLLANAVKFTEAGEITVTVLCDAARGLTITVADTGIGMSPDEIAIAVEPFGQVENAITKKYQGTGLGLSIARRLVELHGGELIIESAKGAGTAISVHLPAERLILSLADVMTLAPDDQEFALQRRSA